MSLCIDAGHAKGQTYLTLFFKHLVVSQSPIKGFSSIFTAMNLSRMTDSGQADVISLQNKQGPAYTLPTHKQG